MGQITAMIQAFNCESCAKYVCNAMDIRSRCCGNYCECDFRIKLAKELGMFVSPSPIPGSLWIHSV